MLPDTSASADSRIGTLLEMSYFTAPSTPELAPWRLKRAATSSALVDEDFQEFIKSDIRMILSRPPEFQQVIVAAYRDAWPQINLFSNLLSPRSIPPWPNCFTPAGQNEKSPTRADHAEMTDGL